MPTPPSPSQAASTILCAKCSAELPAHAAFCLRCGTPTPTAHYGTGQKPGEPEGIAETDRREALQKLIGDGYVLRGRLGAGGFADVFEAWDVKLKRSVAIKALRVEYEGSATTLERFQREAEAIALLRHPNVIPIYAVGGDDKSAYFVMPKVDGESLAELLTREKKLSVAEATRILIETAGALETAHAAGIVHRDVKPENILLDGPKRRVLVTDFGIAKSLSSDMTGLTGTGVAIGTPHYMSPEQAVGDPRIDHRSDQYSLAVVGYRLLSGQLPFDGGSAAAVIRMSIDEAPTPLMEVAPEVPPLVAAAIARGLQKDRGMRFESMQEFADALTVATRGAGGGLAGSRRIPVSHVSTRTTELARSLPGWRSATAMGALIAGVAGMVLLSLAESPVAMRLAANRDDAIFAAKSFVSARQPGSAGGGGLSASADWRSASALHGTYIARTVPRAIDRASTIMPVWWWQVGVRSRGGASPPWMVWVGPEGRIVAHRRTNIPTAEAAVVGAAAESLAVAELRRLGVDPGTLTRITDSTVRLPTRTDEILRWRRAGESIPWSPTDSSHVQLAVRLMGDTIGGRSAVGGPTVISYEESLELPRRYDPDRTRRQNQTAAVTGAAIVAGILVFIWLFVRQTRHDLMQWGSALRFATLLTLTGFFTWLVTDARDTVFASGVNDAAASPGVSLVAQLLLVGLLVMGVTALATLVESLSAEHRPVIFAGVADLVRGRLVTPELVRAMYAAAIGAAAFLLARGVVAYVTVRGTGIPRGPDSDGPLVEGVPVFAVLDRLGWALTMVLLVALAQLAAHSWVKRWWSWLLVTAAIVLGQQLLLAEVVLTSVRAGNVLTIVALSAIVWHGGVLAGALAFVLVLVLPELVALARYGSGSWLQVALGVVVAVAPLALGVVGYRRLTRRGERTEELARG